MLPMFISHLIHHLRPKNIYVLTASRYFQPPFVVCAPYPKRKETSTLGDFDALNSAAAIAAASQTPLRACRSRPLVHPSRPPPPPAAPYLRLCARRTRRHPTGSPQPRPKRRRQSKSWRRNAFVQDCRHVFARHTCNAEQRCAVVFARSR